MALPKLHSPIDAPRTIGSRGMALIKHFEGYHTRQTDGSCVAYLDRLAKPHVWTIGYGLTKGVFEGMRLTEKEAETALHRETASHEAAVVRLVSVPLTQNQFDALVSFAYNVGNGALERSTLLRKLNAGDYKGATKQFARWRMAGGRVYAGLVRRRKAEADLFAADEVVTHEVVHENAAPGPQCVEAVPDKMIAKAALAKSRKAKTAKAAQNTIVGAGFGWGAWETAKMVGGEASEGIILVKSLASEVSWVVLLGVGLAGYTVFGYLRSLMAEDAIEGKYEPDEDEGVE